MSAIPQSKVNTLRFMGGAKDEKGVSELPLASILPSKTNRKIKMEGEEWDDFVASIKAHGVIQPIAVRRAIREDGDATFYEIMAGERRWRASAAAGRTHIPAVIRPEVTDDVALGMQISENVQREAYQPLELAEKLYLLESMGKSRAELSALIHRSEKRISDILCQLNLIEPLRQIYAEEFISYGHVMVIARLSPAMQEKSLRALYRISDAEKITTEELLKRVRSKDFFMKPIPEKDLRVWAQENANLKLKNAAWKLDNAELYPEAGPCTTCPKRSSNNPALYSEIAGSKDLCMDPSCYKEKATRFVKIQKAQAREDEVAFIRLSDKESYSPWSGEGSVKRNQWVPAKKGECKDTTQGIVMDGDSAGKKLTVCTNHKCKTHSHDRIWNTNSSSGPKETAEQKAEREAKTNELRETENQYRRNAVKAILAAPVSLDATIRTYLTGTFVNAEYFMDEAWSQVAEWYEWPDFPASGFEEFLQRKIDAATLDELGKLLLVLYMAIRFSEANHYYEQKRSEEHEQLSDLLFRLGLSTSIDNSAAATASPKQKGK